MMLILCMHDNCVMFECYFCDVYAMFVWCLYVPADSINGCKWQLTECQKVKIYQETYMFVEINKILK